MFTPFESLPDHARIWIYQSNKKFSSSEKDIISEALTSFTEQWLVHGKPMQSSYKILFDHFLILAADEGYNAASGCSIDGSVRLLKDLGNKLNIDFLDRNTVALKNNDNVLMLSIKDLKQKVLEGFWNKDTLIFNNLISTKGEIAKTWILPASKTWLKRYLPIEELKA